MRHLGDSYTQLDVLAASPVTQPPLPHETGGRRHKEARYDVGATLTRNMQDPSVAFKFGGDIGVIQGQESVGDVITIEAVYTDEKCVPIFFWQKKTDELASPLPLTLPPTEAFDFFLLFFEKLLE